MEVPFFAAGPCRHIGEGRSRSKGIWALCQEGPGRRLHTGYRIQSIEVDRGSTGVEGRVGGDGLRDSTVRSNGPCETRPAERVEGNDG